MKEPRKTKVEIDKKLAESLVTKDAENTEFARKDSSNPYDQTPEEEEE